MLFSAYFAANTQLFLRINRNFRKKRVIQSFDNRCVARIYIIIIHLINIQLTAIRVEHALVARGAVAGVAADAEGGGGVALLPAADEVGLADEGAREADVFNLGVVQHPVDELQAAQTAHQHDGDVYGLGQMCGGSEERTFVHTGTDALARGAVGADLDGVEALPLVRRQPACETSMQAAIICSVSMPLG